MKKVMEWMEWMKKYWKQIVVAVLVLVAACWGASEAFLKQEEVVEPKMEVSGFFGYPGEETDTPTTLVLIRRNEYRILMASSGEYGEIVRQAARFSATGTAGLEVIDANGDDFQDLVCDGLVFYGSPSGLVVWEPE